MLKKFIPLLLLSFILFFQGCNNSEKKNEKELLIYCGITMVKPITEIAKIIEKEQDCIIHITQGGSQDLYDSLKTAKKGDIYFPGSESYRTKSLKDGLLLDSTLVGYNQASLAVKKGNPKNVTNLGDLLRKDLRIVICSPQSGSIGKETKKILKKMDIYEDIKEKVVYFTTDSRNLTKAIKNDEADLVVNWYATTKWSDNKDFVDAVTIDEEYAKKKNLALNLLKFSKHPDIAKRFMEFSTSKEGKEIFYKYGFLDKKEI